MALKIRNIKCMSICLAIIHIYLAYNRMLYPIKTFYENILSCVIIAIPYVFIYRAAELGTLSCLDFGLGLEIMCAVY